MDLARPPRLTGTFAAAGAPVPPPDPCTPERSSLTRRVLLADGAAAFAAGSFVGRIASRRRAWWKPVLDLSQPRASQLEALRVLGRGRMRLPDSLPDPTLGAGTDTIPQIE